MCIIDTDSDEDLFDKKIKKMLSAATLGPEKTVFSPPQAKLPYINYGAYFVS